MRALRAWGTAAALLMGSLVIVLQMQTAPASAKTCTATKHVGTKTIQVIVACPGSPGTTQTGDNPDDNSGTTTPPKCNDIYSGQEVPCTDPNAGAYFPNAPVYGGHHGCNAFMLQPQPPAGSPEWEGHDPSEGSVWGCDTDFTNNRNTFFVPNGQAPTIVDPAVLAQRALGRMNLVTADAKIAPGPNFHTYINIDNWLWIPPAQWHSMSLSVSAGPTTVTVTAAPERVDWNMGNGQTRQCMDAGRPSQPGMTDAAKTTCSYAYTSLKNPAGDKHTVSAQLVYAVTWACTGTCLTPSGDLGDITAPAGQTTSIEVRQRQTVVTH